MPHFEYVRAVEARPEFHDQWPRAGDAEPESALVIWHDDAVVIEGTVAQLRRLLTSALQLLPIDGTDTP